MRWDTVPGKNAEGYADPTAATALRNVQRSIRGSQSREAGAYFENIIEASLRWYEGKGLAEIEKTPEPMKPLGKPNQRGQFLACFTKAAQPDFKGTLSGGRSVVFEAKNTMNDRIEYKAVTEEQGKKLEHHHSLGAAAFVIVAFNLRDFFRVPWPVWRDMKEIYGRKYLKPAELEQYRVQYIAGVLKLLEGIELKYAESEPPYPDSCVSCGKYAGEGNHICAKCQQEAEKQTERSQSNEPDHKSNAKGKL